MTKKAVMVTSALKLHKAKQMDPNVERERSSSNDVSVSPEIILLMPLRMNFSYPVISEKLFKTLFYFSILVPPLPFYHPVITLGNFMEYQYKVSVRKPILSR